MLSAWDAKLDCWYTWCREEYYGLRVRQEKDPAIAINIPVNTTVGPSGDTLGSCSDGLFTCNTVTA